MRFNIGDKVKFKGGVFNYTKSDSKDKMFVGCKKIVDFTQNGDCILDNGMVYPKDTLQYYDFNEYKNKISLIGYVKYKFNEIKDKVSNIFEEESEKLKNKHLDELIDKLGIKVTANVNLREEFNSENGRYYFYASETICDVLNELQEGKTQELREILMYKVNWQTVEKTREIKEDRDDTLSKIEEIKFGVVKNINKLSIGDAIGYAKLLGFSAKGSIKKEWDKYEIKDIEYFKDMGLYNIDIDEFKRMLNMIE